MDFCMVRRQEYTSSAYSWRNEKFADVAWSMVHSAAETIPICHSPQNSSCDRFTTSADDLEAACQNITIVELGLGKQ